MAINKEFQLLSHSKYRITDKIISLSELQRFSWIKRTSRWGNDCLKVCMCAAACGHLCVSSAVRATASRTYVSRVVSFRLLGTWLVDTVLLSTFSPGYGATLIIQLHNFTLDCTSAHTSTHISPPALPHWATLHGPFDILFLFNYSKVSDKVQLRFLCVYVWVSMVWLMTQRQTVLGKYHCYVVVTTFVLHMKSPDANFHYSYNSYAWHQNDSKWQITCS